MNKAQLPIGIFDSGIGGLTVAKAIEEALPHEHFIYFGDTLHMPYGDRSPDVIRGYCRQIVEFLIQQPVKLIIIACNSASALTAGYLRQLYWQEVEIMGVIRPVIQEMTNQHVKKLGIIGTHATIQSGIYPLLAQEYHSEMDIFQMATPLLAPMIEEGLFDSEVSKALLHQYLSNPGFSDRDAILLACTHYPLIKNEIDAFFNGRKLIFDNAGPLAKSAQKYLTENGLLAEKRMGENRFYVSAQTPHFAKTASMFYGGPVEIETILLKD